MQDWTPRTLLEQTGALRALARGLAVDASVAPEDIAQDALIVALDRPEEASTPWLRGVVRKLSLQARRTLARRERRERSVARGERVPSASDVVVQMELQRSIAAAVLELPEAQRQAIVMRFWQDLPPREIAAELNVSVHTVKTRLQRGLAALRRALDDRHEDRGGRAAWLVALQPWLPERAVGAGGITATLTLGALIMKTKISIVAAVVLLVVALGFTIPLLPIGGSAAVGGPGVGSAEPRAPRSEVEAPSRAGQRAELARSMSEAPEIQLRGTFVAVDRSGERHPAEDGRFVLWWAPASGGIHQREVTVQAGRWQVTAPRSRSYGRTNAVLGGRPVTHREDALEVPDGPLLADFELEFSGKWLYPAPIRVVDARTGVDLQRVQVAHASVMGETLDHPGPSPKLVRSDLSSPFELSGREARPDGSRSYFFGAEGYAWRRVEIDHALAGARTIRLVASGRLDVTVPDDGRALPRGAKVWVMRFSTAPEPDARDPFSVPSYKVRNHASVELDGPGRVSVAGLPPGWFLVKVSRWPYGAHRGSHAAVVQVLPRQRNRVTLRPVADVHPGSAAFDGILRIADGWNVDDRLRVVLTPIDDATRRWQKVDHVVPIERMKKLSGRGGLRFLTDELPLGRYHVQVVPLGAQFLIDSRRPVDRTPELEVAEPVEVRVRVVDARSGEAISKARLSWYCGVPKKLLNPEFALADWEHKAQAHVLHAPLGKLYFQVDRDGYRFFDRSVALQPGRNDVDVRLHRDDTGVQVKLLDRGAVVPWPRRGYVRLKAVGHDGKAGMHHGSRTSLSEAGDYKLTFEGLELPDHRVPKPRIVRVRAGQWTTVEVRLERKAR